MMNPTSSTQKNTQSIKQNIMAKLASLAAKITLRYSNTPVQEFIEAYKSALVKVAREQNPEYSIVEIACRTGIDRRYIKQYLNSEDLVVKPPKIKLILDQIKRTCLRTNSKFIQKIGPFQTFESICIEIAPGALTHNSIAKELLRQGNIIDRGSKYELVVWEYSPKTEDSEQQFRILTTEMERLTDTIISNSDITEKNEKQVQRNIFSTQIPPEHRYEAKVKFTRILKRTMNSIDKVITQYEEDTPVDTYTPFGASMFTFGYDVKNKNDGENNKK